MVRGATTTGFKKKYLIAVVFVGIFIYALFGDKGIVDVYSLKKERDGIRTFNSSLAEKNRLLEEKIKLVETDRRYIGHIARTELGMIGHDEIIYRVGETE
jgi:cell division protein FtsB